MLALGRSGKADLITDCLIFWYRCAEGGGPLSPLWEGLFLCLVAPSLLMFAFWMYLQLLEAPYLGTMRTSSQSLLATGLLLFLPSKMWHLSAGDSYEPWLWVEVPLSSSGGWSKIRSQVLLCRCCRSCVWLSSSALCSWLRQPPTPLQGGREEPGQADAGWPSMQTGCAYFSRDWKELRVRKAQKTLSKQSALE